MNIARQTSLSADCSLLMAKKTRTFYDIIRSLFYVKQSVHVVHHAKSGYVVSPRTSDFDKKNVYVEYLSHVFRFSCRHLVGTNWSCLQTTAPVAELGRGPIFWKIELNRLSFVEANWVPNSAQIFLPKAVAERRWTGAIHANFMSLWNSFGFLRCSCHFLHVQ